MSIHVLGERGLTAGFTGNISEGGVFVETDEPLPLGSAVDLQLALPDGGSFIEARGEVRWRWARDRSIDRDGHPGMGVGFTSIADGDRARIARFVAEHRELFLED
jgi:uncharacterized protein (TIGR02266 family)